jgi:hypothetical protein
MYVKADHINNTRSYSYELTSYVNAILAENAPSKKGLLLFFACCSQPDYPAKARAGKRKQ